MRSENQFDFQGVRTTMISPFVGFVIFLLLLACVWAAAWIEGFYSWNNGINRKTGRPWMFVAINYGRCYIYRDEGGYSITVPPAVLIISDFINSLRTK